MRKEIAVDTFLLMMSPAVGLGIRIVVANIISPYISKAKVIGSRSGDGEKIVRGNRPKERFLWMYFFTFLAATMLAMSSNGFSDLKHFIGTGPFWWVLGIGFFVGFGTFFYWKATYYSQIRTTLFTWPDDIIPAALSMYYFHEAKFITAPVAIGIAISIVALIGFIRHDYGQRKREEVKKGTFKTVVPLVFFGYVAVYSVIWGLAAFGQKWWSEEGLLPTHFLFAWYLGTCITAVLILTFYPESAESKKNNEPLRLKDIAATFLLGALNLISLAVTFVAFKWPQVSVQPIIMTAEMICPALIALYFIGEGRNFSRPEWRYFGIAAIGALLIAFNTH